MKIQENQLLAESQEVIFAKLTGKVFINHHMKSLQRKSIDSLYNTALANI